MPHLIANIYLVQNSRQNVARRAAEYAFVLCVVTSFGWMLVPRVAALILLPLRKARALAGGTIVPQDSGGASTRIESNQSSMHFPCLRASHGTDHLQLDV